MCARCAREVAVGGLGALEGRRGRGNRRRWSTRAMPFAVVTASVRMQYVLVAHQVVGSAEPARTITSTSASATVPRRPPSSTAKGTKLLSGLPARTRSRCLPILPAAALAAAAPSTIAASFACDLHVTVVITVSPYRTPPFPSRPRTVKSTRLDVCGLAGAGSTVARSPFIRARLAIRSVSGSCTSLVIDAFALHDSRSSAKFVAIPSQSVSRS